MSRPAVRSTPWSAPVLGMAAASVAAAVLAVPTGGGAAGTSVSISTGRLVLEAGGSAKVVVTNPTRRTQTYTFGFGEFLITSAGRVRVDPPVRPNRSALTWLSADPPSMTLPPGESGAVTVAARDVRVAIPGDHHAALLISGDSGEKPQSGISFRTQVAVSVLVRVPGAIVRRVRLGSPRLTRHGGRGISVAIANEGTLTERLPRGRVRISLRRGDGRVVARWIAPKRTLLPGTSGVVTMPVPRGIRGPFGARAVVWLRSPKAPAIASSRPALVRYARVRL